MCSFINTPRDSSFDFDSLGKFVIAHLTCLIQKTFVWDEYFIRWLMEVEDVFNLSGEINLKICKKNAENKINGILSAWLSEKIDKK
jgi:hypothetical protein